jgi:long-chain fatty acid transport protein
MDMKKRLLTALALALTAALSATATDGINLIGIGPIQQGTAGAGVASAKDSTWLILNPAGLTDVERQVNASFQTFYPRRNVNYGTGTQTDDNAFFIPSLSASFGCCRKDTGYFGLGVYGSSGMGVDYESSPLGGDMTELSVAKMTLTYAQVLDNGWSIGAGPVFVLSRLRTTMQGFSGSWDEAVGAGAIFGVNKRVNEKLKLGASYMTEQFMTQFDKYEALLGGTLNLPQQITVGLAYNVRTNVEVVLDYRWVGWGDLNTLGDNFGWEDQNIVKAGITWDVDERLTLRGGISHGKSPIGSEDVFMNSLFPAIMETHLTAGASYALNESFDLDVAYIHALDASQKGPGPGAGTTTISMYQDSLTLGLSWKF